MVLGWKGVVGFLEYGAGVGGVWRIVDGTGLWDDGEIWWACGGVVLTGDLKGLDSAEGVLLKRRRLGAGIVDIVTDPTARCFTSCEDAVGQPWRWLAPWHK